MEPIFAEIPLVSVAEPVCISQRTNLLDFVVVCDVFLAVSDVFILVQEQIDHCHFCMRPLYNVEFTAKKDVQVCNV